ncbi:sarcalumenin-like isoform X1 [Daphnia carinata]|uniref:sarcalumenin-like isoform X1 n=2 Tax=Daphnia carinata TaxID=120202 RepID=UPI00257A9D26|nr:sarcalumenin-like isoform X1 [Daphnia carinata]
MNPGFSDLFACWTVGFVMSGRVKRQGGSSAVLEQATLSINERILKECHTLYTDADKGLVRIAEEVGLNLLAPRKKITVILIGNHSAGKSSFINWYIEEHVQRTGVAIETQGFTFVTSGRKRESLTGNATLHLYPHFKPLQEIPGVVDYLTTEISTSKQKKFSLVTFVDTPGLVDGDMKYPFDVNESIQWLGELADLIFVFFDPIGQALCKRTLNLVEQLNIRHPERLRFYLSKADEAGTESDRQRVMMQIVQELCKRPGLNKTGFDMPTIYIPNPNKLVRCVNQIEDVCKDIEKTINQTIQNTLNTLEKDCEKIAQIVDKQIEDDNNAKSYNLRASGKGIMFMLLGLIIPVMLIINFMVSNASRELLVSLLGENGADMLRLYLSPIRQFWDLVPEESHLTTLMVLIGLSLVLLGLARWSTRLKPTLSRSQKRRLADHREFVQTVVKAKKKTLYQDYLQQSVAEHDL